MIKIPFCDLAKLNRPMMAEIEQALLRVARSGRYIGGTEVSAFEEKLCDLTGARHAVGVGNGLDALKLVLRGLVALGRLNRGDGVIVAANTYIASMLAIEDAGLVPIPVDPDRRTMLLDGAGVSGCHVKTAKAVMPVHLYGRAAWDAGLVRAIEERGLLVIEDNAQALGARTDIAGLNGRHRMTGALGDAGALSFYPTKNVGALGDAGAVLTDDTELASAVRSLSNYGSDRRYHNVYSGGCNSRLDPMQAAVLGVKLGYVDAVSRRRRDVAVAYYRMIENDLIEKPDMPEYAESHVWHQYVIKVPCLEARDAFRKYMHERGIETDVHYAVPPHRQPCYEKRQWGDFPVTCEIADRVVSLPVACVSSDEAEYVAETVNRWRM